MAIQFNSEPTQKWEINDEYGKDPVLISLKKQETVFGLRRINRFQRTDRIYLPKPFIQLWGIDYENRIVYIKDNILYKERQKDTLAKSIVVNTKAIYINLPKMLAETYKNATHVKFIGNEKKCTMEFLQLKRADLKYRNPLEYKSRLQRHKEDSSKN